MYDFERCHCEFYFDKLVNAAPIDSTLPLPRPSFSLVIATERWRREKAWWLPLSDEEEKVKDEGGEVGGSGNFAWDVQNRKF